MACGRRHYPPRAGPRLPAPASHSFDRAPAGRYLDQARPLHLLLPTHHLHPHQYPIHADLSIFRPQVMRPLILGVTCLGSVLAFAGCAVGLQAEVSAPAYTVPQAPETVRVRVLYTKSPAGLSCTGPYEYQMRAGGKLYARQGSTR